MVYTDVRHITKTAFLLSTLLIGLSASAAETPRAGGAGVHWNQAFLGHVPEGFAGGELTESPGVLTCIGGVGFAVLKNTRLGGEGTGCFARDSGMLQAGAQIGGHLPVGDTYLTLYAGLGYGRLEMTREREYGVHFAYVRPAVAIGLPLGAAAIEVGVYGTVPFAFGQRLDGEPLAGSGTFPHLGLLAAVLFGKHPRQRLGEDALVDGTSPPQTEEILPQQP